MRWASFMQYINCVLVPRLWYIASSNDVTADVRDQLSGLDSCMLYDLGSDIFCILAFAILSLFKGFVNFFNCYSWELGLFARLGDGFASTLMSFL